MNKNYFQFCICGYNKLIISSGFVLVDVTVLAVCRCVHNCVLPTCDVVVCYVQSPSIDNVVVYQDAELKDEIVFDVEYRYASCIVV